MIDAVHQYDREVLFSINADPSPVWSDGVRAAHDGLHERFTAMGVAEAFEWDKHTS